MQYKLLATTALVAAGLWGTTEAAFAQAKVAPITVVVGGYHDQAFGYAGNQNNRIGVGGTTTTNRPNKFTQYSDSEIWFGGRTTLANGITIGFDVQLEGNTAGDVIDESYLFVDGAFGRLVMGSENDAAYIMHVSAPNAGRSGFQTQESAAFGAWIQRPTAVSALDTTAPKLNGAGLGGTFAASASPNQVGNDGQRVTYYTPRFFGLQAGASYTPNLVEDSNTELNRRESRTNGFTGGLNYTNNFGAFNVQASAGITYWPKIQNALSSTEAGNSIKDYSVGAQVGYAGFAVGGSYRNYDSKKSPNNGRVFAVGGAYSTGPFAIALNWLNSRVDGAATAGRDKFNQVHLTGAYTMGPGVELYASIFYLNFNDGDTGLKANDNKGVGVATGLKLNF